LALKVYTLSNGLVFAVHRFPQYGNVDFKVVMKAARRRLIGRSFMCAAVCLFCIAILLGKCPPTHQVSLSPGQKIEQPSSGDAQQVTKDVTQKPKEGEPKSEPIGTGKIIEVEDVMQKFKAVLVTTEAKPILITLPIAEVLFLIFAFCFSRFGTLAVAKKFIDGSGSEKFKKRLERCIHINTAYVFGSDEKSQNDNRLSKLYVEYIFQEKETDTKRDMRKRTSGKTFLEKATVEKLFGQSYCFLFFEFLVLLASMIMLSISYYHFINGEFENAIQIGVPLTEELKSIFMFWISD
jgi:hypothetical protein